MKFFRIDIRKHAMFFVESGYAKLHRNKRAADALRNTTGTKNTVDREAILKMNKLLSAIKPQLCHVIQMVTPVPQALPVHLDRREIKDPGDEEDTKDEQEVKATKVLWDRLERVASKASWDLLVRRVMLD